MRTKHLVAILVLLALALPASPAHAGGVVTVCDEAHLLAALAGGGTVTFACNGTITLTNTITIDVDTSIDGSGQTVTISGNNAVRVLAVASEVTLNLNSLTIANGFAAESGGGIYNFGGTVIVCDSTFAGNTAMYGGGIENGDNGTITVSNSTFSGNYAGWSGSGINNGGDTLSVSNSTFSDNYASGVGGGIYNGDGETLTVSSSTFSGNSAWMGGGIDNFGTLTVSNSTFSGNSASDGGGGIYNIGTLTVNNSAFSSNKAHDGGGILTANGTAIVSNSTISGNSANHFGGGIYNGGGTEGTGTLSVINSTFSGNTANKGGGIGNRVGSTLTVSNSTFTGNRAWSGGGIDSAMSTVTVSNSTFSANIANHGGAFAESEVPGRPRLSNTIVANSLTGNNCYGTTTDGGGNLSYPDTTCPGINADPLLGPLQNNGGPTDTMMLGPGSAAIDAGIDAICAAPPVNNLDQRGIVRPQGLHCDIGSVEQILEPTAVSLTALSAQSLPGAFPPTIIAGLLLAALVGVGVRQRRRHA